VWRTCATTISKLSTRTNGAGFDYFRTAQEHQVAEQSRGTVMHSHSLMMTLNGSSQEACGCPHAIKSGILPLTMALIAKVISSHAYCARFQAIGKSAFLL
jgi:hypothetical protein